MTTIQMAVNLKVVTRHDRSSGLGRKVEAGPRLGVVRVLLEVLFRRHSPVETVNFTTF